MKTNYAQQEILLMTGTTFSARQCCEKDPGRQNNPTEKEQLEEACWNGLLQAMMPEIYGHSNGNKELFLWEIKKANSFIELELGELPEQKDAHFSIDPYAFTHLHSLS
jgi:hypothetical protein